MKELDEYLAIPGHVSAKKAAEMLGISEDRIYQFTKSGRLPSKRVSRMLMIPIEAVEQFRRSPTGRARTQPPKWRAYSRGINLLGTEIEVCIRPGQEAALQKKLRAMLKTERHRFTGSVQRYIFKDKKDPLLVTIWLVWKDSEMPDEEMQQKEMAAFKDEFADVLDWDTAVVSSKEGIVYT